VSRAGGVVVVLALVAVTPVRSQPATVTLASDPDQSTLEVLKAALTEGARAITRDGVERSLRVESHWPARSPRARALATELSEAVTEALPETGGADGSAELLLELSADDRELRVALVPREAEVSWWRTLFFRPAATRRWRVPLDAELRAFVDQRPAASRSALAVTSARLPASGYLAVGTIEGQSSEPSLIVVVGEGDVSLFRLREGRRRASLTLVGRAERPPGPRPGVGARRAFATLAIEGSEATVQWRDRVPAYELRWAPLRLEPVSDRECPELAHRSADACAEPVDGRDYFASALLAREGHPTPRAASSSFYARWQDQVRRSDGSVADVEIVVNPRGRLVARTGRREIGLQGHGAALGAGDIDADGQVEILVSGSDELGERDALGLLRLQTDGGLRRLWSEEVAGGVRVAGSGDLDGDGVPELFAIAEAGARSTLHIVRGPR